MQPNPRKTTSLRQLGKVDIAQLRDAVLAIPEAVWDAENQNKPNQRYESVGAVRTPASGRVWNKTRHIIFRFIASQRDWRVSADWPLWPEWRERLLPVMETATRPYGYMRAAYPRVMLARLASGGEILPHMDNHPAAQWPHKIHVPLTTNPQVGFRIGDTIYHLPAGEAFEVNNMGIHAVRNDGTTDRIHLIFEYYDLDQPDPDWIQAR
jgi:Aspartyl/Asparaginyl beta-hydroxylase